MVCIQAYSQTLEIVVYATFHTKVIISKGKTKN